MRDFNPASFDLIHTNAFVMQNRNLPLSRANSDKIDNCLCQVFFMLLTLICGLSHLDAQTTIWEEDFESYSANEGVTSNGPYTYTPSNGKWTIETGSSPDHFKVKESGGDLYLEAKETDG